MSAIEAQWLRDCAALFVPARYTPAATITCLPTNVGATGLEEICTFCELFSLQYSNFLSPLFLRYQGNSCEAVSIAVDSVRQAVIADYLVTFMHTDGQEWLLPGLLPTRREITVLVTYRAKYYEERISSLEIQWNQLPVLFQAGVFENIQCKHYSTFRAEIEHLPSIKADKEIVSRLRPGRGKTSELYTLEGIKEWRRRVGEAPVIRNEFASMLEWEQPAPLVRGAPLRASEAGVLRPRSCKELPTRRAGTEEREAAFCLSREINKKTAGKMESNWHLNKEAQKTILKKGRESNTSTISFQEGGEEARYSRKPTISHNHSMLSFEEAADEQNAYSRKPTRNHNQESTVCSGDIQERGCRLKQIRDNNKSAVSFEAKACKENSGLKQLKDGNKSSISFE